MRVEGCGNTALAYRSTGKPFSAIPLERGEEGPWKPPTIGTVLVNGVKMRAVFDTGAQATIMTLDAAKRAGVTPASAGVTSAGFNSGTGSKQLATWFASFDKIDLGGEILSHPRFRIANIDIDGDILIGFDLFVTHRMFVSNLHHMLYMTDEGGPLFGLTPIGARTATGERLDLTDKTADPTDAEGFSRRGAVFLSKRRFAERLADLDRAVTMAPNEGDSLDQPEPAIANDDAWLKMHGEDADRAVAYDGRCWARALLDRELDRALSDCNAALRIRPGFASYLDSRALVELRLGRLDAALADHDAAVKANPRNAWSLYTPAIAANRAGRKGRPRRIAKRRWRLTPGREAGDKVRPRPPTRSGGVPPRIQDPRP